MGRETVVVLDNGGATCKIGLAGWSEPRIYPNAIGKVKGEKENFIGDQLAEGIDISSVTLRRPVDRGYTVNWDLERQIWQRIFQATIPDLEPSSCGLVVTEPLFNLPALQEEMLQVVFEEFGFRSVLPAPAPLLSLRHWAESKPELTANRAGTALVVDAGFSFTHTAPVFDGMILSEGVKRLNLGGKPLTNYFKELVSYRSINMMEETHLVDHIKEQVCFVSTDLPSDLAAARAGKYRLDYVLPDGVGDLKGHVREPAPPGQRPDPDSKEQVLNVGNERFVVPELIFNPSDIGVQQGGLPQSIVESVNSVHPDLHALLYSNVVCTGGFSACPGFRERLLKELRPLVPTEYEVNVEVPGNPITCAWHGGSVVGASPQYAELAMTRADYEERGFGAAPSY